MNIISSFLEIFKVETAFNKRKEIYENGADNAYPELVDRLIKNSVTAKRCSKLVSSYVIGEGFGEEQNKMIVNEKKGLTLLQFGYDIAKTYTDQQGVFIHVNYSADLSVSEFSEIPYTHCRLGKSDDNDYSGKILVKKWNDPYDKKDPIYFDVFNPRKDVVQAQIEAAGGIKKYRGQILFVNNSNLRYPLSTIDSSLMDAESENKVSVFKNVSLKKGFFGKTLVVTPPFVDGNMDQKTEEYQNAVSERENFKKTIQQFVGAENSTGVLHLEMELDDNDIDKVIMFKNIETNINDELFKHTETSIRDNICISYGVPPMLISQTEGSLFSSSGEAYTQMKLQVQESSAIDRRIITETINKLLVLKGDQEVEIELLIKKEEIDDEVSNEE